jgi:hypothetical protein
MGNLTLPGGRKDRAVNRMTVVTAAGDLYTTAAMDSQTKRKGNAQTNLRASLWG